MGTLCREKAIEIIEAECMGNHVHMLMLLLRADVDVVQPTDISAPYERKQATTHYRGRASHRLSRWS